MIFAGELTGLLRDLEIAREDAEPALRARLQADPLGFLEAAADVLVGGLPHSGEKILTNLLRNTPLAASILTDREAGPLEMAVRVARKLMRMEPAFDVHLAQWLLKQPHPPNDDKGRHRRLRGIDILRKIGSPARLAVFQVQFLREADPNIRSKAVQMVAEVTRNLAWFRGQIEDADPRVRSNAVEALWDSDWEDAIPVFEQALSDPHHRVITTALVGLAKAGQWDRVVDQLIVIAGDERAEFRAAAAWAMETIPDQRFRETLINLARDSADSVRPRAFAALRAIERRKRERDTEPAGDAPLPEAAEPDPVPQVVPAADPCPDSAGAQAPAG